jgi:methylenetetrahydrofolate dehydrogenase (NADP+)/methenyltetrahydrofolate cyclohydrolase
MVSQHQHLPEDATQAEVEAAIERFNDDDTLDGILFQYPPPDHIDHGKAIERLDPDKDVDAMHPLSLGRLAAGLPGPQPCTPAGVEAMLAHYRIPVSGRHVVVLGRGVALGRPLSLLLSQKRPTANAAVTVVHTGVPDWGRYTREAEIVVVGVGVPNILQPEHIRPGSVVVGAGATYRGKNTVVPDVDEACGEVAGWITPRLGGVGKTTIAMLMRNTVEAAERRQLRP